MEWLSSVVVHLGPRDLLLEEVNWQLQDGLDYYQRRLHPELNLTRAGDAILTLPFLVRANISAGRAVYATPMARDVARAAYGDLFAFEPDPTSDSRLLAARLAGLPPGTPYVLAVLLPYPDVALDEQDLRETTRFLTGGTAVLGREASYTVIAGRVGERPLLDRREDHPWRAGVTFPGLDLDLRMESWLASDTIRRAGFGQVIANRKHVLIIERGVSVVALSADGDPTVMTYSSSLLAPLPRYRVVLR
jgi:hypothetical protein